MSSVTEIQPASLLKQRIVKNASANLLRLTGSGIVAFLLTPFLVRTLPKDIYSAWALLLQLTLYIAYLDFGIQIAVAKFVAHADELNDDQQRDSIVSTAFIMLAAAATLGCAMTAVLAWQLPRLFNQMPGSLYRPSQLALLFMGCSLALGLPVSAIYALFTGFQRNEIPAANAILNKVAMAALIVAVVLHHYGLAMMGAAVAAANGLSYASAYAALRMWGRRARMRISLASRACARQIATYSSSVVVWMAAMLMVSGLDLTIVGIFDYKSTAYYAVAATLTNFVAQAQGAIFAAFLPASAVLMARGDSYRLGAMLMSATRYGMLILLAMALPLLIAGHYLIYRWAGAGYAQHSTLLFQVLLVANVVRLWALPYATLLLGTGQQQKVILSPLAEGVTNLAVSIGGAYLVGAIGVAVGTLIGAFVSVGLHVLYNMPRTSLIFIDRPRLVKEGLLRPLACACPLGVILLFHSALTALSAPSQIYLFAVAALGTGLLFWKYGLVSSERQRVTHALGLL